MKLPFKVIFNPKIISIIKYRMDNLLETISSMFYQILVTKKIITVKKKKSKKVKNIRNFVHTMLNNIIKVV